MSVANNNGTRHMSRGFGVVAKAVMRDQTIPVAARALYALLATYADDHGECYPANSTLAADMGTADSTVRRLQDELESHGVIEREPRMVEGRRTSNLIRLVDVHIGERPPTGGRGVPPTGGRGVPPTSRRVTTPLVTTPEENNEPPSVVPAPADTEPPPKRSRRKPETPLPEDFALTAPMLEWAKNEGTPSKAWVEQQTKEFVAWVQAVDKRYVNWEQAWRNSILRAMDRAGSNGSSHGNGNGAAVEEFDADGYALDDMRRGIRRGPQKLDFE